MQLRADVDSALGRLHRQCVLSAIGVTPDVAAEWMRQADLVEQWRSWALKEIDRWITERSKA